MKFCVDYLGNGYWQCIPDKGLLHAGGWLAVVKAASEADAVKQYRELMAAAKIRQK